MHIRHGAEVNLNSAYAALSKGNYKIALLKFYQNRLSNPIEADIGIAKCHLKLGNNAAAYELLQILLESHSEELNMTERNNIYLNLAKYYKKINEYLLALEYLNKAAHDFIPALIEKLDIHRRKKEWAAVEDLLLTIEEMMKDNPQRERASFGFDKTKFLSLRDLDRRAEAKVLLNEMVSKYPGKTPYIISLVRGVPVKDTDMKKSILEAVLEQYPENFQAKRILEEVSVTLPSNTTLDAVAELKINFKAEVDTLRHQFDVQLRQIQAKFEDALNRLEQASEAPVSPSSPAWPTLFSPRRIVAEEGKKPAKSVQFSLSTNE